MPESVLGSVTLLQCRRIGSVRRVDARLARTQQPNDGFSAPGEPDDGYLAPQPLVRHHRSFNVVRATNAQRMPSIQKRTTTCVSVHPDNSK